MQIVLNGSKHDVEQAATVAGLIEQRQPRPPFAVEINKLLVRRPDFATTPLKDGDIVEIVTLVGGG